MSLSSSSPSSGFSGGGLSTSTAAAAATTPPPDPVETPEAGRWDPAVTGRLEEAGSWKTQEQTLFKDLRR